jgi:hypothetical protein
MDMSIGGRAAMAQHQYRVRKYGIDGGSPDNSAHDKSPDDWGRIMDDACSIVSFSSSAFFKEPGTPRDRSRDDVDTTVDVSSSYFDKSVINSLLTPQKVVSAKQGALSAPVVTMRGGADESPDKSVGCCSTNISDSNCSGIEEMLHAALRFQDDLQESILSVDVIETTGKDKSSSVSFAADTSFATNDGRSHSRRKKSPENIGELNFLFGSPINKHDNDDSFGVNSSLFGSPISPLFSRAGKEMISSPSVSDESASKASPCILNTTPLRSGRQVTIEDQSSFASFLGLTPAESQLECNHLTPKKNLFEHEETEPVSIEFSDESIELIRRTPSKPSSRSNSVETNLQQRTFGSNLQNTMHCDANADSPIKLIPKLVRKSKSGHFDTHMTDENVRGVRLCRASKLKSLGLEQDTSLFSLQCNESEDRSDF